MKTDKNILIAFLLNLFFSVFEFIGGLFTNSVAIMSDAIHDLGDALGIGISYLLERKSKQKPNSKHTYGYARYSVIGAAFTSIILFIGSIFVIINAINRILNPVEINYHGMIILAIIGVIVNFIAAYFTKDGESLNQKAVNLHMLEDVLGWVVVLIGSIAMRFTNISVIDPILSIIISIYLLVHVVKNLKEIVLIFAETIDDGMLIPEISRWLSYVEGVKEIHHLHIWRIDETKTCATVHIVTTEPTVSAKRQIRHVFNKYGITHVTIEFEEEMENCSEKDCELYLDNKSNRTCCHHHNHKKQQICTTETNMAVRLPRYEIEI